MSDIGGSVLNYFYYDGDQRRIITEDSGGRTYFLYDEGEAAVKKNASGTTLALASAAQALWAAMVHRMIRDSR